MSYSRHTWVDNETISAAKLNNIEDGVEEAAQAGGSAIVRISYTSWNGSHVGARPVYGTYNSTGEYYELYTDIENSDDPYVIGNYNAAVSIALPKGDLVAGIAYPQGAATITTSGGVASTPVYGFFGEPYTYELYIVTGDGTITIAPT